jgi:hypothetical protein
VGKRDVGKEQEEGRPFVVGTSLQGNEDEGMEDIIQHPFYRNYYQ